MTRKKNLHNSAIYLKAAKQEAAKGSFKEAQTAFQNSILESKEGITAAVEAGEEKDLGAKLYNNLCIALVDYSNLIAKTLKDTPALLADKEEATCQGIRDGLLTALKEKYYEKSPKGNDFLNAMESNAHVLGQHLVDIILDQDNSKDAITKLDDLLASDISLTEYAVNALAVKVQNTALNARYDIATSSYNLITKLDIDKCKKEDAKLIVEYAAMEKLDMDEDIDAIAAFAKNKGLANSELAFKTDMLGYACSFREQFKDPDTDKDLNKAAGHHMFHMMLNLQEEVGEVIPELKVLQEDYPSDKATHLTEKALMAKDVYYEKTDFDFQGKI